MYNSNWFDPNDNRTEEERLRDGCLALFLNILAFFLVLLFFAIFSSCTTHRHVCDVTVETGDSLSQFIAQTQDVTTYDNNASQTASVFSSSAVATSETEQTDTETITEQITETTDSAGTTTRTTSRTIKRNSTKTDIQQLQSQQQEAEIALKLHLSYLDSLYESSFRHSQTHWADSISHQDDRQTTSPPSGFIHSAIKWFYNLSFASWAFFLIYLIVKYFRGK